MAAPPKGPPLSFHDIEPDGVLRFPPGRRQQREQERNACAQQQLKTEQEQAAVARNRRIQGGEDDTVTSQLTQRLTQQASAATLSAAASTPTSTPPSTYSLASTAILSNVSRKASSFLRELSHKQPSKRLPPGPAALLHQATQSGSIPGPDPVPGSSPTRGPQAALPLSVSVAKRQRPSHSASHGEAAASLDEGLMDDSRDDVHSQASTQVIVRGLSVVQDGVALLSGGVEAEARTEAAWWDEEVDVKEGEHTVRMTSIAGTLPGETELHSAQRALSNTSDNADEPTLDRTYCQWEHYHAYLFMMDASWEHEELKPFFAMDRTRQARCQPSGLPVYGDLCDRHARKLLGLVVRPSDRQHAGLGLFTVWLRRKGELICEYKGNVRLESNTRATSGLHHGKYAIDLPHQPSWHTDPTTRFVIDATRTTDGHARYINDFSLGRPEQNERNNCLFRRGSERTPQENKYKIYIEARTDIAADTELSASYGNEYWTDSMRR